MGQPSGNYLYALVCKYLRICLSVLTQFLSDRSGHVRENDCRSKLVNVVVGVPHSRGLGPLLFLLQTSELFPILKKKIFYADDSTLMAVVLSSGVSVTVAELIRDRSAGLVSGVTFGVQN